VRRRHEQRRQDYHAHQIKDVPDKPYPLSKNQKRNDKGMTEKRAQFTQFGNAESVPCSCSTYLDLELAPIGE
jgi:hypothetical protein